MGQIKLITAILLTLAFSFAIINFTIGYASDNDAVVSVDENLDIVNLEADSKTQVDSFSNAIGGASEAFFVSDMAGDDVTTAGGQFKVPSQNVFSVIGSLMTTGFKKIFGNDTEFGFIFSILTGFFALISILYIWKTWKGNPD